MNHLNDFDIQAYLDSRHKISRQDIGEHLEQCPQCQARVKEYRFLYHQLGSEKVPVLSAAFTRNIMTAVAGKKITSSERDFSAILYAACFMMGIGLIIYFADFSGFIHSIATFDMLGSVKNMFHSITAPIARFINFDITYLVYIALIFIIIGVLDQIIRHFRQKPISFMI